MKRIVLLSVLALAPSLAQAKYTCGDRSVEVVYLEEGKKAPCEVKYAKPGAEAKVIFTAKAQAGFCEEKAKEFADKLGGMGFACKE